MPHYEILFACILRDGSEVPYARIIVAPHDLLARQIAGAMVGEKITPEQSLDRLVHILPTKRHPSTRMGWVAWASVLERLGFVPNQVRWWFSHNIGLTYNPRGHHVVVAHYHEPEIVGFFPWPEVV